MDHPLLEEVLVFQQQVAQGRVCGLFVDKRPGVSIRRDPGGVELRAPVVEDDRRPDRVSWDKLGP